MRHRPAIPSFLCLPILLVLSLVTFGCGAPSADEPEPTVDASPDGSGSEDGPPAWMLAAVAQPRGLITSTEGATDGYILFSHLTGATTYLVDQQGQMVHRFTNELAAGANYLQDNGDLLRMARIPEPPNFKTGGTAGYIQRLNWDSEVLWQWRLGDEENMLHHDIEPLPNGNILAITFELIEREEALAAGRDSDLIPEAGLWSERLIEIEPVPPNDAKIVWEWRVWDHLVQNRDPDKDDFGEAKDQPRRLDINADAGGPEMDEEELAQLKAMGYVPEEATLEDVQSDFLHMNAVDYNARLDQIAISLPEIGEVWILDHSTTSEEASGSAGGRYGHGGDALYRWGNPRIYGRGEESDQKLFYQHQVMWIPDGYPGAGNLTIFNNGDNRGYSSIVEIVPPHDGDGVYALESDGPFGPAEPAWTYTSQDRESFYAPFISGAQRLPNGNTLICSGPQGRFFEVNPAGETVWEYRNPYNELVPGWNPPGAEAVPYGAFRVTKILSDHPGIATRALAPLSPQPEWYVAPPPSPPVEGEPPN